MKRQKYIAWILMVVSIIMLAAPVFPHHHHQHILCMQEDATILECCTSPNSKLNEGQRAHEHRTCGVGCVTRFHVVSPGKLQHTAPPNYSFCTLLYTIADLLSLSLSLNEIKTKSPYFYLEKLHSTCIGHVVGLRAPPVVLL